MPDAQTPPLEDSEILAVASFRFALRRFEQHTDALVRACGLTPQRYLLLLAVRSAQVTVGYATVSTIARELLMPQTTVTDLVARAADVGLIAKDGHNTDARVVRITITGEGDRRLACAIRRLAGDRANLRQALLEATQRHPA
jgi:DNA-binding MarR family transcriptional regulator